MPRRPRTHRVVAGAALAIRFHRHPDHCGFRKAVRAADETTRRRLRATLEAAGVIFIAENGGGAGVRLKFSREEVWEVNRWEEEGGRSGEDDIL